MSEKNIYNFSSKQNKFPLLICITARSSKWNTQDREKKVQMIDRED